MRNTLIAVAAFAMSISSAHAAKPFKDFAGTKCSTSQQVTIVKVDTVAFTSGPMKGYVNVTVTLPSGESSTAPMPLELAKTLKTGDKACQATFIDQG